MRISFDMCYPGAARWLAGTSKAAAVREDRTLMLRFNVKRKNFGRRRRVNDARPSVITAVVSKIDIPFCGSNQLCGIPSVEYARQSCGKIIVNN